MGFDPLSEIVGVVGGVAENIVDSGIKVAVGFGVQVDVGGGRDGSSVRVELGLGEKVALFGVSDGDLSLKELLQAVLTNANKLQEIINTKKRINKSSILVRLPTPLR